MNTVMDTVRFWTAAAAVAVASVVTAETVDELEITADTNIVVATGDTLKIEYLWSATPYVVTKSGGGKLVVATVGGITNVFFDVQEGTLASARPAPIPTAGDTRPTLRIDCNATNLYTFVTQNGTNFVSKILDADGGDTYLSSWGGTYDKPYYTEETLNGLHLLDFGTYQNNNDVVYTNGHGGNLALNKSFTLGEYFYVWKDRDDAIDMDLHGGSELNGPPVLGNNPSYFSRGLGGGGNGFPYLSTGMGDTFKMNLKIDGVPTTFSTRIGRGFHLLHNRAKDGSDGVGLSMIGWSIPYGGGFVLAELVAYSNKLSSAAAARVSAQLRAKWFGARIDGLTLREGATLDVSAVKFDIDTLDVAGGARVVGSTNLAFNVLTKTSTNLVIDAGTFVLDGTMTPLVPDLAFAGNASIEVVSTSRVQHVASGTGTLVKRGSGVLKVADPATTALKVEAGTLSVSPLYARASIYHLDAARADTVDWTLTDGKKLVSAWRDTENPDYSFKPTTWRKPKYDESRLIRAPYVTDNVVGDLPMIDFGTFADVNHPDGWGASIEGSPTISADDGLHDVFIAWQDYPEVKNYSYSYPDTPFAGPSFFGFQYHWNRGKGGNGVGFSIHATGCPYNMVYPYDTGRVYLDGVEVKGNDHPVPDGVHVLAQRVDTTDGKPGTPLQSIGGNWMDYVKTAEGTNRVQGVFGGCMVGEVLMFREYVSDSYRARISGALCGKWRNATNIWEYASVEVAAGTTLDCPYTDLVIDTFKIAGRTSARSVKATTLEIAGAAPVLDCALELPEGGTVVVAGDAENGFPCLTATSAVITGAGEVTVICDNPFAFIGQEYKIVSAASVTSSVARWPVSSSLGDGVSAHLTIKSDGLYLRFEPGGTTIIIK